MEKIKIKDLLLVDGAMENDWGHWSKSTTKMVMRSVGLTPAEANKLIGMIIGKMGDMEFD